MKQLLYITFLLYLFSSCVESSDTTNQVSDTDSLKTPQPNVVYTPIKDGLYKDDRGNICFKTVAVSEDYTPVDRYIDHVYTSKLAEEGITEMKNVIDTCSFKKIGNSYFRDTNNIYHFFSNSCGGTMSVIDEADVETFKTFEHSLYAIDKNRAYYRGDYMDSVDLVTFKVIHFTESNGSEIPWYAKDSFHYYDGGEIISESEYLKIEKDFIEMGGKVH